MTTPSKKSEQPTAMTDFSEMGELQRVLGRIEGKIDAIDGRLDVADHNHEAVGARVSSLERRQWYFNGAFAVIVTGSVIYMRNLIGGLFP